MKSMRFTLATMALTLLLAACSPQLNEENFREVQTGMSPAEVEAILGTATESSSVDLGPFSGTSMIWKYKDVTVTVQFVNDEVKFKTFDRSRKTE